MYSFVRYRYVSTRKNSGVAGRIFNHFLDRYCSSLNVVICHSTGMSARTRNKSLKSFRWGLNSGSFSNIKDR